MKFGFQISIRGGFSKVVPRAKKLGCDTIQLFTRNPRSWEAKPLILEDVEKFREDVKNSGIFPVITHIPYLPNFATSNPDIYRKSINVLIDDLKRSEKLGAQYLIIHCGRRLDRDLKCALKSVSDAINFAFDKVDNGVILLLENTAGQGTEIGGGFEELAEIMEGVEDKERIGVCLDIAHAFQYGYDLKNDFEGVMKEFDEIIGFKKLKVLHLNDSKVKCGEHVDRHWHIGKGEIGKKAFRKIVNYEHFKDLPGIMETPRKSDEDDLRNMKMIRSFSNNY